MLSIKGLEVVRGEGIQQHRVQLPQLELKAGQIIAITGESGCGKSTLLESIGLLLEPQQLSEFSLGQPQLNIAELYQRQDHSALAEIRARQLGFVLQNGGLLPFLSVRENIYLPRRLLAQAPHSQAVERAIAVLSLGHLLSKLPSALSIGERQRVACVRALAHHPQLLLADEPTAALDPHNARRLFNLLLELVEQLQLSALIVSHDWSLVREFKLPVLHAISQPGVSRFELAD